MITKILLTIAVIMGLVMYLRRRSSTRAVNSTTSSVARHPVEPIIPRGILYIFVALMLISSAVIFYYNWEKSYRIITVRVINTQSGHVDEYQVRRGEVDGRKFETINGKVVILADVERMEIDVASP